MQLKDAVESLDVGSAWEFKNKIGPLAQKPSGDLLEAFTKLDKGEKWLVKPQNIKNNPYLWKPE